MKLLALAPDDLGALRPSASDTARGLLRQLSVVLIAWSVLAPTTSPQDSAERDQAARREMKGRISAQQRFLVEHLQSNPEVGTTADERLGWMDRAQGAYTDQVRAADEAVETIDGRPSRFESFSPYVWSWMPMLVAEGAPSDELKHRVQVGRVLPSLLADLETVVGENEAELPSCFEYPTSAMGSRMPSSWSDARSPCSLASSQRSNDSHPSLTSGSWQPPRRAGACRVTSAPPPYNSRGTRG